MKQDLIVQPAAKVETLQPMAEVRRHLAPDDLERLYLQRSHEASLDRQAKAWWRVLSVFAGMAVLCIVLVAWFAGASMEQSQAVAMHALDTAASMADSAAKIAPETETVVVETGNDGRSIGLEWMAFIGLLIVAGIAAAKGGF